MSRKVFLVSVANANIYSEVPVRVYPVRTMCAAFPRGLGVSWRSWKTS